MANSRNITSKDIPLALTKDLLKGKVREAKQLRKTIAEGLLYEKTCLLMTSQPGVGKSALSIQAAVELASGLPIFGFFHVPNPVKVLYIQSERSIVETIERLQTIEKTYPINYDNLVITDEYQFLNLLNPNHLEVFLDCVVRDCVEADVTFIDPIYSTVSGGLKEDRPASAFTKAMSLLQKKINCALWLNHHDVKEQHDKGKVLNKVQKFYGAQWLMAAATGSYDIERNADKDGVLLTCKKDNYSLLNKEIPLIYNPETMLSHLDSTHKLPARDRFMNYLQAKKISEDEFTFYNIKDAILVSDSILRDLLSDTTISTLLTARKGNKNKLFYRML